jgi:predicted PurR-regulated permease PerM
VEKTGFLYETVRLADSTDSTVAVSVLISELMVLAWPLAVDVIEPCTSTFRVSSQRRSAGDRGVIRLMLAEQRLSASAPRPPELTSYEGLSMSLPPASRDLVRIVLGVLLIVLLIGGALLILGPFLPALIWATMIVVATWPLLLQLQRALGGRRSLAAAAMTTLLFVIVVAPLAVAVSTIVQQAAQLSDLKVAEIRIPMPPVWIEGVPVVGPKLTAEWRVYAVATPEELATRAAPYLTPVVSWIASRAGAFGTFLLHLLLTLLLCGVLYVTGETAALGVRRFARRLQGPAGDHLVLLAAGSIRAVALGIVVTAIVQTALGTIGLVVAGAPYVAIFAAVMFVFCIAQLGPALPMLAAVGWLYLAGAPTAAIGLFVWTVIVGLLDNVLRPMLIRRGADLPLLLVMAGVIGGLISLGLVGLFVGPVVLAVAYTEMSAWIAEQDATPDAGAATPAHTESRVTAD